MFFHPPKSSNPIGQKIKGDVWEDILAGPEDGSELSLVAQAEEPGTAMEFSQRLEGRVRAMSLIHELLYESDDLGALDMADYIPRLTGLQVQSAGRSKPPQLDLSQVWVELSS